MIDNGWGLVFWIAFACIWLAAWLAGRLEKLDDRRGADEIRRVMSPEQRWPGGGW